VSAHPLARVFEPRSIAVVGASADPHKRGHQVIAALQRAGYPGRILPVNPRVGSILGLEAFRDIHALPAPPDLAYVARPAPAVPDIVRALGELGAAGAVVPAVGFREAGPEGAELEAELTRAALDTAIRVIGPNTSGIVNTHQRVQLVGGPVLSPGALGILSQSGNVALDLMTTADAGPLGVSVYAGPGNEADVRFDELLDFLGGHGPTRAIAVYAEGFVNPAEFFRVAETVARRKPVVVLKGGRSHGGGVAALSHTGAVAGPYEVFLAFAREAGLTVVERSDELLPVATALAFAPPTRRVAGPGGGGADQAPPGSASDGVDRGGAVVLSDGGGHGTLAADALGAADVPLARLSAHTRSTLREMLGPAAATGNPIDVAGAADRDPELLAAAIEQALQDPGCSTLLVTGLPGGYALRFSDDLLDAELRAVERIARAAKARSIPLIVHSLYAQHAPPPLRRLGDLDVAVVASLDVAVRAVEAVWRRATMRGMPSASVLRRPGAHAGGEASEATAMAGALLSEVEARALLAEFDMPFDAAVFCADEAAIRALDGLDAPRVLKIVSAGLPHRTAAGAVRLGVRGAEDLARAFRECRAAAERYMAERGLTAAVDGALIAPRLPAPSAQLLVGARREQGYGPVLTIGFGGTEVELLGDVATHPLPADGVVTEALVRRLLGGLRLAPLLFGGHGSTPVDLAAVAAAASALGRCLVAHPEIASLEVNPLFSYDDGALAVDASGSRAEH
jgi:acyl-CoA synthetase (NDP forming)